MTTTETILFEDFPKIPRLSRGMTITEKLDGTNAQILITESGDVLAGSRTRFVTPEADNYGFARWVKEHESELLQLGVGRHFGEWWGCGIQRGYGLTEKRFSLFNVARWHRIGHEPFVTPSADPRMPDKVSSEAPACCHVVPVLFRGEFNTACIQTELSLLSFTGSRAAPGFQNPEGIIIWHEAARCFFKKTLCKDEEWKGKPESK